jgi:hypothetical protein
MSYTKREFATRIWFSRQRKAIAKFSIAVVAETKYGFFKTLIQ